MTDMRAKLDAIGRGENPLVKTADQARAAYVETVLTEKQRRAVARWQSPGGMEQDERVIVVAIIDQLIAHGVECEGKLSRSMAFAEELRGKRSRLTAVRELRDTWHRNNDKYKKLHVADVVADLDRILDDASTGGTET